MSIAEQRSLIRGLSSSGLLPQLEKVTLGDGTTSYVRNPGRGPGRDLFAVGLVFCAAEGRGWWVVDGACLWTYCTFCCRFSFGRERVAVDPFLWRAFEYFGCCSGGGRAACVTAAVVSFVALSMRKTVKPLAPRCGGS